MSGFYFLGVALLSYGLLTTILSYGFRQFDPTKTYHIGAVLTNTIIVLALFFVLLYGVLRYMQWSCSEKVSKKFKLAFFGVVFASLPFGGALFYALFGPAITIETY